MRKFVENLHILLLVNSKTLLSVAEGKPGSGFGTRSQFNCTKTIGGRMQISSAVEPHRPSFPWHVWCLQSLENQSRGELVEVARDRWQIYLLYRLLYRITFFHLLFPMGGITPSATEIWPQGTVISILSIPQRRTSTCAQWNTSQSREAYRSVFWSITAASLNSLSVDRSNAPGYTETFPTGRQQTN